MMYLFLGFVLMVTIRGQNTTVNLADYVCTGDNECAELTTLIQASMQGTQYQAFASMVTSKCSQKMGFCTIDCTIDLCGALGDFGISGLTCSSANKLCEADITCVSSDTECTVSGLAKCGTTAGVCIPDQSAECENNAGCASLPGLGYCEATRLGGKDVSLCSKEACCPADTCSDSNCITSAYICQPTSGFCSAGCSTNDECNPVFAIGLVCNTGNGLCESQSPTKTPSTSPTRYSSSPSKNPSVSPSKNPSVSPSKNPSASPSISPTRYSSSPSTSPSAPTTKSDIHGNGARKYHTLLVGFVAIVGIAFFM